MESMVQDSGTAMCSRCKDKPTALIARNEAMCTDCFVKYVSTKVVKRLEAFSRRHIVPGQQKRLLVPLSFGASSTSLLHLLHRQIQWQLTRTKRAAYELHVLHVYDNDATAADKAANILASCKKEYPGHSYEAIPLASIYNSSESSVTEDAAHDLALLFDQVKSSSSRADLERILLRRVIVRYAQIHNMHGIFWGESTTKLAEAVVSESSKGRGYALPWSVSDGETPFGLLFYFPLRDVLRKEILQFIKLADLPLSQLAIVDATPPMPVSSKNMTIDILSRQYFESVEANYPSIVSNVVRTSTKLEASIMGLRRCKLCQFPVTKEQLDHNSWQGLQRDAGSRSPPENCLCYGCHRTISAEIVPLLP